MWYAVWGITVWQWLVATGASLRAVLQHDMRLLVIVLLSLGALAHPGAAWSSTTHVQHPPRPAASHSQYQLWPRSPPPSPPPPRTAPVFHTAAVPYWRDEQPQYTHQVEQAAEMMAEAEAALSSQESPSVLYSSPSSSEVLYARPSPGGGYSYRPRRRPAPRPQPQPLIIRVHKHRVVRDDRRR